jgi:hypothetical protein
MVLWRTYLSLKLKTLKKLSLIFIVMVWISGLIILIITLTDLFQNSFFKEYKLVVGIGFIALTGFTRIAYQRLTKNEI